MVLCMERGFQSSTVSCREVEWLVSLERELKDDH